MIVCPLVCDAYSARKERDREGGHCQGILGSDVRLGRCVELREEELVILLALSRAVGACGPSLLGMLSKVVCLDLACARAKVMCACVSSEAGKEPSCVWCRLVAACCMDECRGAHADVMQRSQWHRLPGGDGDDPRRCFSLHGLLSIFPSIPALMPDCMPTSAAAADFSIAVVLDTFASDSAPGAASEGSACGPAPAIDRRCCRGLQQPLSWSIGRAASAFDSDLIVIAIAIERFT